MSGDIAAALSEVHPHRDGTKMHVSAWKAPSALVTMMSDWRRRATAVRRRSGRCWGRGTTMGTHHCNCAREIWTTGGKRLRGGVKCHLFCLNILVKIFLTKAGQIYPCLDCTMSMSGLIRISHSLDFVMSNGTPGAGGIGDGSSPVPRGDQRGRPIWILRAGRVRGEVEEHVRQRHPDHEVVDAQSAWIRCDVDLTRTVCIPCTGSPGNLQPPPGLGIVLVHIC